MTSRKTLANAIRFLSMDAVQKANSGHPGAPMGMADIAEVLWRDYLKHNPANPHWSDRDRFVLSKGHVCPIQYSALGLLGFFPEVEKLFISQILDLDVEGRFISGRKTSGHKILLVSVRGRKASGLYPDDVDCLYFTVKL